MLPSRQQRQREDQDDNGPGLDDEEELIDNGSNGSNDGQDDMQDEVQLEQQTNNTRRSRIVSYDSEEDSDSERAPSKSAGKASAGKRGTKTRAMMDTPPKAARRKFYTHEGYWRLRDMYQQTGVQPHRIDFILLRSTTVSLYACERASGDDESAKGSASPSPAKASAKGKSSSKKSAKKLSKKGSRGTGGRVAQAADEDDDEQDNGTALTAHLRANFIVYMAYNIGESIFLVDYFNAGRNNLDTLDFRPTPTVVAFKPWAAADQLEMLITFDTGDILVYLPRDQRFKTHLNEKGESVNSSSSTAACWVPGTEAHVLVAHADGNLYLYDTDAGDSSFEDPLDANTRKLIDVYDNPTKGSNPLQRWHVSNKPVTAMAFSPDGQYLATCGRDGILRIFDFVDHVLLAAFRSYYGAFLCVAWSHDGRMLLTGGEDDLVSLWSFEKMELVARCPGHSSWVSAVAFDDWQNVQDARNRTYRFASVAQDTNLCIWEYSEQQLKRPRLHSSATTESPSAGGGVSTASSTAGANATSSFASISVSRAQKAPGRRFVAQLEPMTTIQAHLQPLTCLRFVQDGLVTACTAGVVKVWSRPDAVYVDDTTNTTTSSSSSSSSSSMASSSSGTASSSSSSSTTTDSPATPADTQDDSFVSPTKIALDGIDLRGFTPKRMDFG